MANLGNSTVVNDGTQYYGKIDGQNVTVISKSGSIYLSDKIDGHSTVRIRAKVAISIAGKIDGKSRVELIAPIIHIGGKIDGHSTVLYKGTLSRSAEVGASSILSSNNELNF